MEKKVIFSSTAINDFVDLRAALRRAEELLEGRANLFTINLADTLRLQLIERTLTDGSKVYDIRLIEE